MKFTKTVKYNKTYVHLYVNALVRNVTNQFDITNNSENNLKTHPLRSVFI